MKHYKLGRATKLPTDTKFLCVTVETYNEDGTRVIENTLKETFKVPIEEVKVEWIADGQYNHWSYTIPTSYTEHLIGFDAVTIFTEKELRQKITDMHVKIQELETQKYKLLELI